MAGSFLLSDNSLACFDMSRRVDLEDVEIKFGRLDRSASVGTEFAGSYNILGRVMNEDLNEAMRVLLLCP